MIVKHLFSSPKGDIPIGPDELVIPFKVSPSKDHPYLTLGGYFEAIKDFIMRDNGNALTAALTEMLNRCIGLDTIDEILIRSEKHGALYHVASIEIFESITFADVELDFFETPFWLDTGILRLREIVTLVIEINIVEKEIAALQKELRITTQRVNLFEKIKIPECLESIRRIRIYLGDQQSNAVGIGKVAKKKIEARDAIASA